jgi:hypothetical protein
MEDVTAPQESAKIDKEKPEAEVVYGFEEYSRAKARPPAPTRNCRHKDHLRQTHTNNASIQFIRARVRQPLSCNGDHLKLN